MKRLLLVVDMQNDFVTGSLKSEMAQAIIPAVQERIAEHKQSGSTIIYTLDTHGDDYLNTAEGKKLPVEHCIEGTDGWNIIPELSISDEDWTHEKPTFGSIVLADIVAEGDYEEIELCGLCTDICIVTNALILKTRLPYAKITVHSNACAGVTEESHKVALLTMQMCQIEVV